MAVIKKIILFVLAAFFVACAVSSFAINEKTVGIMFLVIATVCACFTIKKKKVKEIKEDKKVSSKMAKERIVQTLKTKVVGVTFDNEDGENRQTILSNMSGNEEIEVEKYLFKGEPAAYIKWNGKIIGNLSAEIAKELNRKYPKARYAAKILEISGGGGQNFGCNIELDIIENEEPEANYNDGTIMVYVEGNSKKYHTKPNCSGMKNPKKIPLNQAKKKYSACKRCCK